MSLSIYELQRLKNIQENNSTLISLGIEKLKDPEEETKPKKPRQPKHYEQRDPNPRRNCRKDDVHDSEWGEGYWVNRFVLRVSMSNHTASLGMVTGFVNQTKHCNVPLWRVRHTDGHIELVNEKELHEALCAYINYVEIEPVDRKHLPPFAEMKKCVPSEEEASEWATLNKPEDKEEYQWYDYDYSVADNTLLSIVDGESEGEVGEQGEERGEEEDGSDWGYDYSGNDSESDSEYSDGGLDDDDYEGRDRKYRQDLNYHKRTGKTTCVIRKQPVNKKKKSEKQKGSVRKMPHMRRSNDEKDTELGRKKLGDLGNKYAHLWKDMHGDMPIAEMNMAEKEALKGLLKHRFISADLAGYTGSNPTPIKKARKIATLLFGDGDTRGCFLTVNSMLEPDARKRAVEYVTSVNQSTLAAKKVITNQVGCFKEMVDFIKDGLFDQNLPSDAPTPAHEDGHTDPPAITVDCAVWAKVRGFPWWPARVQEVSGKNVTVFFFGTEQLGKVGAGPSSCVPFSARPAGAVVAAGKRGISGHDSFVDALAQAQAHDVRAGLGLTRGEDAPPSSGIQGEEEEDGGEELSINGGEEQEGFFHKRPRGRAPKGKIWDTETGKWKDVGEEEGEDVGEEEGEDVGEGDAAASVDRFSETEEEEKATSQEPQVIETSMMRESSFEDAYVENGVEEKEFEYFDESEDDYTVDLDLATHYPEEDPMEIEEIKVC